jgi:hypothetical protein
VIWQAAAAAAICSVVIVAAVNSRRPGLACAWTAKGWAACSSGRTAAGMGKIAVVTAAGAVLVILVTTRVVVGLQTTRTASSASAAR